MKAVILQLVMVFLVFFQQLSFTHGRAPAMIRLDGRGSEKDTYASPVEEVKGRVLQVAGSSLPDCSHACGACSPCIRVIVGSSKCSIDVERAEACPVAYRCMCRGKSYPVPIR